MKERTKTKSIALLTAFLMVFAMMPLVAFGEEASISGLWVGDSAEVTAVGLVDGTNASNGSAAVSIENEGTDKETLVLTLSSFSYTGEGHRHFGGQYYSYTTASICYTGNRPLKIELAGENTVAQSNRTAGDDMSSSGIYTDNPLTITGGGSLDVSGGSCNVFSCGLNVDNLTIKDTTVDASGTDGDSSYGIYCRNMDIDGSKVTATAGEVNNSLGISAGKITIDDSEVSATGNKYGIYATSVDINSGSVTASGTGISGNGIYVDTMVTIGEAVTKVEASGYSSVILGNLKNAVPIKAWNNVEGTGNADSIEVYSDTGNGYDFNVFPYAGYKKVLFETPYKLWVGGTRVTSANCRDIPAAEGYTEYSGKASYDDSTKTLTLHDYSYEGPGAGVSSESGYSVYYDGYDVLTIVLEGTNTLKTTGKGVNDASCGVYVGNGSLCIKGSGALNSSGGQAGDLSLASDSVGISAAYSITIESGTVNATGDTGVNSYGLFAKNIIIKGGKVTAKSSAATERSFGLYAISNITIGENALFVDASGEKSAVSTLFGNIDNKISGTGWTDVEGTKGETSIPAGTYTTEQLADYKKIVFPEVKPAPDPTPDPKPTPAPDPEPAKVSGTLMAKMTGGKNSATVTWNKISGAEGYDVYFAKCTKKKDKGDGKLVKTVNAGQTLKCTQTGLKKKAAYKAYVRAFVMKDGKKQYMKTSPEVHAATSGGKYTNPKSVKVKKTKVTLKKGKTAKIKAKVKKLKAGKKLLPRYHDAKVRYLSSDPKIATVSAKGKIKAKAKGTCKIYVYAVNGAYKTVKVTVK